MRAAIVLALLLLFTSLAWVWLGSTLEPLQRTCAPELSAEACDTAVDAVLRRGTPALHPLILDATITPGSAPGADQQGHRATVHYTLLALPTAAEIELYYDQGGHWGGRADPGETVVAALALEPLLLAVVVSVVVLAAARRRAHREPAGSA